MTTEKEITPVDDEPQRAALDPMVSMIERVALDGNADLEKLERMLAMKERLDATSAQTAFNEALAGAQAKMPAIAAKHNNDQTRSKYAKLSDIYQGCKPIADQYGFSFNAVPEAGGRDGFLNMRWTLRRGAHVESAVSEIPLDGTGMKGTANKTGTHAFGSTATYGRRYLFCAVFDIAIGEDDDGNTAGQGETISAEQYVAVQEKIEAAGIDEQVVLDAEKIKALDFLPASRFAFVIKKLEKNIAAKAAT